MANVVQQCFRLRLIQSALQCSPRLYFYILIFKLFLTSLVDRENRRTIYSSSSLMNEDPVSMAKLKEAPLKNLDDIFSSEEKQHLITVDQKVYLFTVYFESLNFLLSLLRLI